MFVFWIAATALAALSALAVLAFARRGARATDADPTLGALHLQLADVDELAERGLLSESEREGVRAEAGRRMLHAADRPSGRKSGRAPAWLIPASAGVAPVLAAVLYTALGAPGAPDQPFAERVRAWRATPERLGPNEAAAVLEQMSRERPSDAEARRQLARARMAGGDAFGAVAALEAAARLEPRRTVLWTELGQALLALQPPATADARRALGRALTLAPGDLDARYWIAAAAIADGQTEAGLQQWRSLARDLAIDDPRRAVLLAQIEAARRATAAANPAPGASAPDIRAMVDGLAVRLRAEPNDPEGWARLARAYAVLGDEAELASALEQARRRFSGPALARIEAEAAAGRRLQRTP